MRGVLTCMALEYIQKIAKIDKYYDYIDIFGGTSTGSIEAACLANGLELSRIQDIYRNSGKLIFKETFKKNLMQLTDEKYDNTEYLRILNEVFQTKKLSELGKHFIALAFNITTGNLVTFSS